MFESKEAADKSIANCKDKVKRGIPATKEQIASSLIVQMCGAFLQAKARIERIKEWLLELDETLSGLLEDRETDAFWHTHCMDGICGTQLLIGGLFDALAEIAICQRIYQGTQNRDKSGEGWVGLTVTTEDYRVAVQDGSFDNGDD